MLQIPWLSFLIFSPMLAGGLMLLVKDKQSARVIALLSSILSCVICFVLWSNFDTSIGVMQFVEHKVWIPSLKINYALGIDGIALPLIMLTSLFTLLIVVNAKEQSKAYVAAFLALQGLMHGVFAALDVVLFYLFWEAMLIPMFLIIGLWGGQNRIYATLKFFIYTFLGSIFLLVAFIYLYVNANNSGMSYPFAFATLYKLPLTAQEQLWLFIAFVLAFAVKIPMWPVHTWLPDAHLEAPTDGSVILAAVMLKMGAYGLFRFVLPITKDACLQYGWIMVWLSLIAIVYIGLVALRQRDMKKLIAYSSIAHMGFVTLGIFVVFTGPKVTLDNISVQGAYMQMISHGLICGALFFCIGMLYNRMHTREINHYGGVAAVMPKLAALFMVFALANCGLPGTSGFVGEFLVIVGAFKYNFWYSFTAGLTLILGAAYTLWLYKRVFFGPIIHENVASLTDLNTREVLLLLMLALGILGLGLYPAMLFNITDASITELLQIITKIK